MRNVNQQILDYTPRTVSADSGVVDTTGGHGEFEHSARFCLDVGTPTGTAPTLNVFIYGAVGGKNYLLHSFTQVTTAASRQTVRLDNVPKDVVVAWTIAGTTPSYPFEVWVSR
jgi:hypothetical protein